jgi:hypothetical protein
MYCPQCGKKNLEQQRFCRSCGLSLHDVALAMTGEPLPTLADETGKDRPHSRRGWSYSPVFYALLLIVTGALAAGVFGPSGLHLDLLAGIGGLIALLGIGLLGLKGVLLIVRPSQPRRDVDGRSIEATKRLEPGALAGVEPASVTEHTTRSLEPIVTDRT